MAQVVVVDIIEEVLLLPEAGGKGEEEVAGMEVEVAEAHRHQ
jgi:hypothetical protein